MHAIYVKTRPLFSGQRKDVVNGNIYGKLAWILVYNIYKYKSQTCLNGETVNYDLRCQRKCELNEKNAN